MPFIALNAAEDELRRNDEKVSLEFQFEDALRLFERALAMQKDKDPGTLAVFLDLLRFPLFDLDANKNAPPSTPRLKCLALKNYCILMLDELQLVTDPKQAKEQLLHIIDQLLEALALYNDPAIISLLLSLALPLNNVKVARVALEELVSNTMHRPLSAIEAGMSSNAANLVGPRDEDALARLRELTVSIGDLSSIPSCYKEFPSFQADLQWIRNYKFDNSLATLMDQLSKESLVVKIPKRELTVIASSVEDSLGSISKKRKNQAGDAYQLCERSISRILFQAPHEHTGPAEPEPKPEIDSMAGVESAASPEISELEPAVETTATDVPEPVVPTEQPSAVPSTPVAATPKPAAPVPLRSSARNRGELGLPSDFSAAEVLFSQNVSSFLALVGMSYANVLPDFEGRAGYLSDFNTLLENWDDDQASQFTSKSTAEVDLSLPVMQMLDFAAIKQKPGNISEIYRPDLVDTLLEQNNSHIQLVRYKVLELLLCSSGDERPLVLTARLEPKLQSVLTSLVDSFASQVAEFARSQPSSQISEMSQALFEFYVDKYTTVQREIRKAQANTSNPKKKSVMNETSKQEAALRESCALWRGVTSDLSAYCSHQTALRFAWVSIFHNQAEGDEPDEIMAKFEEFKELIGESTVLTFDNWPNIPTASMVDADTQVSKFRAVSIFSRVFARDDDTVPLLEAMLMPESYTGEQLPEAEAIEQFLKTCSLEFKLNLWYLLLDQYEQNGEPEKSLKGLLQILDFGIKEVTKDSLKEKGAEERSFVILQCVNLAHDVCRRMLPLVRNSGDLYVSSIEPEEATTALGNLIKLCELVHIFTINDHAVNSNLIKGPTHHSWETAVKKLRELSTLAWCLLYLFFITCLSEDKRNPEILNDSLSLIHDHLGNRGYCSLADGALLELNISVILLLNWSHSEADLLQCIRCRYGISLSSESFTPFAHYALTVELTRKDALRLSGFIMEMILSKKNLAQVIQRQNVRLVLSTFNEAIGPPNDSTPLVLRNLASLESFIDSKTLDLRAMRQIIKCPSLSLLTNSDPIFELVGKGGLYYVMALVHLNQYKIKKRTAPEKTDDLVEAVKFLTYDLAYGSNRFESWMSLCQAFDSLAETSLTFTVPEDQKVAGLGTQGQRKAILCGCMAVHALANVQEPPLSVDYFETLAESLPSVMGRLLYYAASSPLSMTPFDSAAKFVFADGGYEVKASAPVDRTAVLKLALYYLEKAEDWASVLLKSELLDELNHEPSQVLGHVLSSLDKCAAQAPSSRDLKGNQDMVFEPQQQLFVFCWKYFTGKRASNKELIDSLAHSKLAPSSADTSDASFTKMLIECLEALCLADKKHWMHQPRFLLSQIHKHLGDTKAAQREMDEIISTKSVTRPLVGIWKPKLERSGEHFNFCRDYVMYYADLVVLNKDDLTMAQLARKARKFTSVTDYPKVWNHILVSATTLVKDLIGVPAKFTEKRLNLLEIGQFEAKSMALEKLVGDKSRDNTVKDFSPWLQALDYAHDIKKLNIGLGSTATVDDLVTTLYLCLYDLWEPGKVFEEKPRDVQKGPAPADASKKVKVSKKDVLTKAALVLRLSSAKLFAKSDAKSIPPELHGQGHQFDDPKVVESNHAKLGAAPSSVEPVAVTKPLPEGSAASGDQVMMHEN